MRGCSTNRRPERASAGRSMPSRRCRRSLSLIVVSTPDTGRVEWLQVVEPGVVLVVHLCSGESAVLPREVGKERQLLLRLAAEELDERGELPLGRAFVQFLAVH